MSTAPELSMKLVQNFQRYRENTAGKRGKDASMREQVTTSEIVIVGELTAESSEPVFRNFMRQAYGKPLLGYVSASSETS